MGVEGCPKIIKYLLFVFNLLFFVSTIINIVSIIYKFMNYAVRLLQWPLESVSEEVKWKMLSIIQHFYDYEFVFNGHLYSKCI